VPLEIVAFIGAMVLVFALLAQLWQLWISIRDRDENRVFAGDPWDGRSLEWAIAAPAPEYNFAVIPVVKGRDAFTTAKEEGTAYQPPVAYADIELPKNCAMGPAVAAIGFALAFGLVWHIWWMVILSAAAAAASMIMLGFARDTTRIIPAAEVKKEHERWLDAVARATPVSRAVETKSANTGLALHDANGGSP
jgi:cytochrome o ubiquinol oxidase subunit 1